jgi:hypothetical protein
MHHVAVAVGVQQVPFAVHTAPPGHVAGHFAGRPQRLVTVTPHWPRQAVASSGVQHVPSALQTSPGAAQDAVSLSPQATTCPQLFIAVPQFLPAHVLVAGSGAQPQLLLTQAAPPGHCPQSTWLPQLSYSCPQRLAQKLGSGTQLPESWTPASAWAPLSTGRASPPPPSDSDTKPSGGVVASPEAEASSPPPLAGSGPALKSPRRVLQPAARAAAARTKRTAKRRAALGSRLCAVVGPCSLGTERAENCTPSKLLAGRLEHNALPRGE